MRTRGRQSRQVVVGVLFMAVGALLMLENFDLLAVGELWRYWPLVLITMGVANVVEGPLRRRQDGFWMMMVGTWLLLNMLEILQWQDSWPLMIVIVGVNMVLRAITGVDQRDVKLAGNSGAEGPRE
jgi:NADH:ubiquinone oxidoreductase subunit 5 (subunit L)/multisubunit Na+/H+ antiporter MnhA subunit